MTTLLFIVLSGLRVTMDTVIARRVEGLEQGGAPSTAPAGEASRARRVWSVEDFDQGGLFTIVPVGGSDEVRLHIPNIRLHLLRLHIARWIGRVHDYQDLFPFPSFTMNPKLFEKACAAVLAARLNALRSTQGERIMVADIFPGCSMSRLQRLKHVKVAGEVALLSEMVLGDVTLPSRGSGLFLAEDVTTDESGTLPLAESGGRVLRRLEGAKCTDVHFVLPYPGKPGLAHYGIQCKSGASERFDALAMYEEAMEYMAPVAGMDHYYVLAALWPELVDRPREDAWPDGLIIVDSVAEFAPLMRTLPPRAAPTRRRRAARAASRGGRGRGRG
jgi:hypothetical protein